MYWKRAQNLSLPLLELMTLLSPTLPEPSISPAVKPAFASAFGASWNTSPKLLNELLKMEPLRCRAPPEWAPGIM